jgi:phosphatidylserine/phosphatidylglycerophosphate/cardiolipin synthase-like enzyme
MNAAPLGLSTLPLPELERLRMLVAEGRLNSPLSDGSLRACGFPRFADLLAATFTGLSAPSICIAIDVAIAERVHRPPPHLRLVWTGPEGAGATARDTSMLVKDLFANARQEVLIAGFAFDHGADIFAPLHQVMVAGGVKATLFVDIKDHAESASGAHAYAEQFIAKFLRENWPFGPPLPVVYYDPRTAMPGPPWVSLHAKCIVVDERLTFVTSANFTERGQERNIELGVLIEDAGFAREVAAQWWGLVREGRALCE